jgi:hypothetical protein
MNSLPSSEPCTPPMCTLQERRGLATCVLPHHDRDGCGPAQSRRQRNGLGRSSLVALSILVAAVCTSLLAMSIRAGGNPCLVMLQYSSPQQLKELDCHGIRIINYQQNVLAAICNERETRLLRHAGFQPRVLASIDADKQVYLVYPQGNVALLTAANACDAYSYTTDALIVQADVDEANELAIRGADIVRLPQAITLSMAPTEQAPIVPRTSSVLVHSMVQAVSPTLLIHHVCKLQDRDELSYCNELGTRYSFATADLAEAAEYLYTAYASYGLDVTYDPFLFNSKPMTNVVAELSGNGSSRDHIYIISAHYDSISQTPFDAAPGADDNASGVAAVLEIARILSQHSFPCTIRFVNFAGEEQGLIGSAHYAEEAARRGDIIHGVLNLDMIAYESVPPNDHKVDIHAGTALPSISLAEALLDSVSDFGLDLLPQVITASATWRSDHASFWNQAVPALLAAEDMDDFNPHYHSTRDTLTRIRPQLMAEFTKACIGTLARLASQSYEPTRTPTPLPSSTPEPTVAPTATMPPPTATPVYLYLPMTSPAVR